MSFGGCRLTGLVYIGGAASISFLQIVRNLVSQQIGPSAFSHNETSDKMLEIESPTATTDDGLGDLILGQAQKVQYLNSYLKVVCLLTPSHHPC